MNKRTNIQMNWQGGTSPPDLDEKALCGALRIFLDALGYRQSGVSVMLADDTALAELNLQYRGRRESTDILSWPYKQDGPAPEILGDLAVSLQWVQRQAAENGWDRQTELLRLLAHGCAHLAGHGHATPEEDRVMRDIEIELLDKVGLENLYPR